MCGCRPSRSSCVDAAPRGARCPNDNALQSHVPVVEVLDFERCRVLSAVPDGYVREVFGLRYVRLSFQDNSLMRRLRRTGSSLDCSYIVARVSHLPCPTLPSYDSHAGARAAELGFSSPSSSLFFSHLQPLSSSPFVCSARRWLSSDFIRLSGAGLGPGFTIRLWSMGSVFVFVYVKVVCESH